MKLRSMSGNCNSNWGDWHIFCDQIKMMANICSSNQHYANANGLKAFSRSCAAGEGKSGSSQKLEKVGALI